MPLSEYETLQTKTEQVKLGCQECIEEKRIAEWGKFYLIYFFKMEQKV